MDTCFIFVDSINETGCLSLFLNDKKEVLHPLKHYEFSTLKSLSTNKQTVGILSAKHCNFQRLELPWLPEKKARAAIPFALEEELAENIDELHFAFDKKFYNHGHYLVAVTSKALLVNCLALFKANTIRFDKLTVDWFALCENELCITEDSILVNLSEFRGYLPISLVPNLLQQLSSDQTFLSFTDSMPFALAPSKLINEPSQLWLAKRLLTYPSPNLLQGSLRQNVLTSRKKWFVASSIAASLWLLTWLGSNAYQNYSLSEKNKVLDNKIAAIYHQFFPQATQIISPRFRIEQWLKNSSKQDDDFWNYMTAISQLLLSETDMHILEIRYANSKMQLNLTTSNFLANEKFKSALQSQGISVKQLQAANKKNKIYSTLELSL